MSPLLNVKKRSNIWARKERGVVILTSTILLSVAGIVFTVNMASSQLIDNKIIANYYRNNEAFANAESGINFVLSQLDDPMKAQALLTSLPTRYESPVNHYQVTVDKIMASRLSITSEATSIDGSARRTINLEADFYLNFPIPTAAVSVNGKLNLDSSALVNDGCEGLGASECLSAGNIAENMLLSNPSLEVDANDACSGGHVGENIVASNVLKGSSLQKTVTKVTDSDGVERYNWGKVITSAGSLLGDITPEPELEAGSLFEATFALSRNQQNLDKLWDNAAQIDTTNGEDCSELLQFIDHEKEIIYIKGDCHISQYYTEQSNTSENKVFTIGSTEHPKLVLIEGGSFSTSANTGAKVIGMLYFLPISRDLVDAQGHLVDLNGTPLPEGSDAVQIEDSSVDMGGININGALLSEYKCSHDGYDKRDSNSTKQHFSARFDKLVLDKLYSDLGMITTGSGYRVAAGTWRDF